MSFKSKRKHTKTIVYFQSKFTAQEIWEYLTHPKFIVKFTKDPCYNCQIPNDFKLEKNHSWTEVHTGEDCEGDIVESKITNSEQYKVFSTLRYQAGIKNITVFKLMENEKGTLISEEQIFRLSLKKMSFLSILAWFMLFTGLLTRFSFKPDDDLYWFENMEEEVAQS